MSNGSEKNPLFNEVTPRPALGTYIFTPGRKIPAVSVTIPES
jgi:hypothetical protein